jgi:hypothetical protein
MQPIRSGETIVALTAPLDATVPPPGIIFHRWATAANAAVGRPKRRNGCGTSISVEFVSMASDE